MAIDTTTQAYIDLVMSHERELREIQVDAVTASTLLAAAAMDKRLEGMNEFRAQLKDQSATFIARSEYQAANDDRARELETLKSRSAQAFTREEHAAYMEKTDGDIRVLRESKALLEGKASQQSVNVALIIGVIGLLIALAGLVRAFMTTKL